MSYTLKHYYNKFSFFPFFHLFYFLIQSSQSSPNIGMNSPRIAQMREPNQHAQTEERQYSMTRIIDSLNASGNCSGTRHNLYRPKRIVHPSKYKSSPYDNYTRHQTISAAELNHYNNILSIGETQQYK